ncbi:MAG: hypothetical protein JXM68_02590, partial [Sedimentisphaerales bacterium]|nr:hypothetical protein [Sedimentisphaerales bacterium]
DEIYSVTIPVDIAETAPVTKSVGVFYIDKAKNVSVTTSQTVKIDNQIIAPQGVTVVYPTNQTQIKRGDTFKVYALIPEVDSVPLGGSGVDTVQFYGRAGSELAAVYPAAANLYMLAESACGIDWDGDSLLEDNIFGISLTAPAGGFPVIDESTDNFAVRVIDNTGLIAQTDSTLKIDDQILNPADFVFHYLINGLFRAKNGDACNISFKLPEYDAGVRTVTLDLSSMGGGIITSCQNEADAGLDWNQAAPAGQTDIWGMNFTVNDTPDTENIVRNITVEYTDFAGNSSGITDIDVYIDNLARYTSFRILYPSGKEQIRLNDGVTIEVDIVETDSGVDIVTLLATDIFTGVSTSWPLTLKSGNTYHTAVTASAMPLTELDTRLKVQWYDRVGNTPDYPAPTPWHTFDLTGLDDTGLLTSLSFTDNLNNDIGAGGPAPAFSANTAHTLDGRVDAGARL